MNARRIGPRGPLRRILLATLCVALLACGAHDSSAPESAAPEPIPECERYVAAYRACFGALGSEAHRLTEDRATELHEHYLAAARDEATRESARQECAANVTRLQGACR